MTERHARAVAGLAILGRSVGTVACQPQQVTEAPVEQPEVIYFGGPILTMAGAEPTYAEAVAVREGLITFVGSAADALELQGPDTTVRDLDGRAMLPGFIDAHGHLKNVGFQSLAANLLPPPDGDVSIDCRSCRKSSAPGAQGDLSARAGLGHRLRLRRRPTGRKTPPDPRRSRRRLPGSPYLSSFTNRVTSTSRTALLLELAGIDAASTEDPAGGIIRRRPDSLRAQWCPRGDRSARRSSPCFRGLTKRVNARW